VRQPGYSVWDAVVAYRATPNLDLRLNVYNLFDKYYYQAIGSTQDNNHFGAPRSFLLTAKYTF
jgi:outer membrane receptor for ferric coprogen and ferric-rhodotorulic acid